MHTFEVGLFDVEGQGVNQCQ